MQLIHTKGADFILILVFPILAFGYQATSKNNIAGVPVSTEVNDSLERALNDDFMVGNYRMNNGDTFFYYYAGKSTSCINNIPSFQIPDTTYDYVTIKAADLFQYPYNEDSIATADAIKDNRKYYVLVWYCQKGKMYFYYENDTLFKLNPFKSSKILLNYGGENFNNLPRWIPYSLNWLNDTEFEVQKSSPPFYPIVNLDSSTEITTVFSKGKRIFNSSNVIWIKQ
ncbi:MAG: hypothetical protein GC181_13425 [Bacteroidetes bacterium]|nr:hypothetical protein [Bacteroidota bacterium]